MCESEPPIPSPGNIPSATPGRSIARISNHSQCCTGHAVLAVPAHTAVDGPVGYYFSDLILSGDVQSDRPNPLNILCTGA
jgi:hypothetical protein